VSHSLRAPLRLGQSCRGFLTLTEKTVRGRYAYRVASALSLLANAVGYLVFVLVWRAVYAENPGRLAVPAEQLFPYLMWAFALNFVLTLAVDGRFMQRVRLGLVTSDLLRPMGFMPVQLAQAVGDVVTNAGMMLPLVAVGVLAFGVGVFPPTASALLFGLLSLALAFLVNFGISYLIVQATFLTDSSYGVFFTRVALHQVFSGLSAPLALFPGPLRAAAAALPFHCVVETPVRIWLGQATRSELPGLLLTQLGWAAALLLLSGAIFDQVLKRHQIQGG
jgi:ABC-2 type transport system permease protein